MANVRFGNIDRTPEAGCMKKYKDFKIKEDGGKARIIMAPDTKRRVEEYMKEKTERENE